VAERMRALADPEVRRRLNEVAHSEAAGILRGLANWERLIIVETFVLGYDECQAVLTDSERFSSAVYEQIMGPVMGKTLLEQEEDEHRASRALVSPLFRAKLLERWRTDSSRWRCMS
jgi:cytochrome P450